MFADNLNSSHHKLCYKEWIINDFVAECKITSNGHTDTYLICPQISAHNSNQPSCKNTFSSH